jgi:hypothetical protein
MFTWSLVGATDLVFKGIYRTVGTILRPFSAEAAAILFDAAMMLDFEPCSECDSRFECKQCGCLWDAQQRLVEAEAEQEVWEAADPVQRVAALARKISAVDFPGSNATEAEWLGNTESSCSGVETPQPTVLSGSPPLQESPEGVAPLAGCTPSGYPTFPLPGSATRLDWAANLIETFAPPEAQPLARAVRDFATAAREIEGGE